MGTGIANGGIAKLKEYLVIAKIDGIKNLYLEKIPKEQWDNEYKTIITNVTEDRYCGLKRLEMMNNGQKLTLMSAITS